MYNCQWLILISQGLWSAWLHHNKWNYVKRPFIDGAAFSAFCACIFVCFVQLRVISFRIILVINSLKLEKLKLRENTYFNGGFSVFQDVLCSANILLTTIWLFPSCVSRFIKCWTPKWLNIFYNFFYSSVIHLILDFLKIMLFYLSYIFQPIYYNLLCIIWTLFFFGYDPVILAYFWRVLNLKLFFKTLIKAFTAWCLADNSDIININ